MIFYTIPIYNTSAKFEELFIYLYKVQLHRKQNVHGARVILFCHVVRTLLGLFLYQVDQKSDILLNNINMMLYTNRKAPDYYNVRTIVTFAINNSQFKCAHLVENIFVGYFFPGLPWVWGFPWGFPWVWVWYGYGDCDESPWVLWVICGDF